MAGRSKRIDTKVCPSRGRGTFPVCETDHKSTFVHKKRIPHKKDMRFLPPLYGLPLHRAESEADCQCFINVPHGFFVERAHFLAQAAFVQRADLLGQDDGILGQSVVGIFALLICDVIAAAITVGLYRLPTLFCTISTGRMPPCSLPTTGLRSA